VLLPKLLQSKTVEILMSHALEAWKYWIQTTVNHFMFEIETPSFLKHQVINPPQNYVKENSFFLH
jgi:hypothetical protein